MHCQYLSYYSPANNTWSVASCSFKRTPYIPSVQELEKYCKASRDQQCPAFAQSLPPLQDQCFSPELAVIALAQCR
ncbi:MAG: hypothetical protein ABIJ50_01350 [Pseudomonadota bacterium]